MELETINKLYLELSQVATATTSKELRLKKRIEALHSEAIRLCDEIETILPSEERTSVLTMAYRIRTLLGELSSGHEEDNW